MDGTTWSLLANIATTLGTVGVALAGFWQFVKRSQREQVVTLIKEIAVSQTEFEKKLSPVLDKIDKLEKFSSEFQVIKYKLEHVHEKINKTEQEVQGLRDETRGQFKDLSVQITGAVNRVAEMSGLLKANER